MDRLRGDALGQEQKFVASLPPSRSWCVRANHLMAKNLRQASEDSVPPKFDLNDYPPIPPFSLMGALSPLILVPAVLPAAALYLAPANVLDAVPVFRIFVDWMGRKIRYILVHAEATQIPQVAALVNCLVVAAAVLIALVFATQAMLNYRYLYRRHVATGPHPFRAYWLGFFGAPFALVLLATAVMIPGDVSWAPGASQSRTLTYGLLSIGLVYFVGLCVGGLPLMVRLFLDAFLFSRPVTTRD